MTIPFFGSDGRAKLPNYTYRTKSEQLSKLKKFLKDVEKFSYIYETENEEAGSNFLLDNKDKIDLNYVRKNYNEKVEALIDIAVEELTPEEVLNILYRSSEPESGAGVIENSLLMVPVKTIETDLNQFRGKINTKIVDNVYQTMIDGLTEEQIENAHDAIKGDIDNEVLYQEPRYDFWQAVINEDKLKDYLVVKLQTNERELEEKNPAVANCLVKVLADLIN